MLRSDRLSSSFTRSFLCRLSSRGLCSLSTKGYQSIGSFHSDNLADLLSVPDESYNAPELPFLDHETVDPPYYALDLKNWTFLNHGAFGAALNVGTRRAEQWRQYKESQPLRFFDRTLLPHLAYSTRRMAQFVHLLKREEMALLPNVTSGINSVISSYFRKYGNSGHVILWDTSYGSVKKMAYHYGGGQSAVTEIPFQQLYMDHLAKTSNTDDVFLQALRDSLNQSTSSVPLIILDHVSSNTALTFPIQKLAAGVKEWNANALVLVDGAHGLLAQPLHVGDYFDSGVDFYLSNAHKWLSAPRGAAFMAVNDYETRWQDSLFPSVYSHGGDAVDLLSRFVWDGTRDYAASLALPVVLDFWEQQGQSNVRNRIRKQLQEGMHVLAKNWHPEYADNMDQWQGNITLARVDSDALSSPMILVKLPSTFGKDCHSHDAKAVQDYLFSKNVEVPIKCINRELYARISCHIYNSSDDFVTLANAIKSFPGFR